MLVLSSSSLHPEQCMRALFFFSFLCAFKRSSSFLSFLFAPFFSHDATEEVLEKRHLLLFFRARNVCPQASFSFLLDAEDAWSSCPFFLPPLPPLLQRLRRSSLLDFFFIGMFFWDPFADGFWRNCLSASSSRSTDRSFFPLPPLDLAESLFEPLSAQGE